MLQLSSYSFREQLIELLGALINYQYFIGKYVYLNLLCMRDEMPLWAITNPDDIEGKKFENPLFLLSPFELQCAHPPINGNFTSIKLTRL